MDTLVTPVKEKSRSRWHRRSTGKRVTPGTYETVWFEKLHHHGPLTTTYLHKFTEDVVASKDTVKGRLKGLFHEKNTAHGSEYLNRPEEQNKSEKHLDAIHENDRAAEELLKERGLIPHTAFPSKRTNFAHRFMSSCITASIELTARDAGIGFVGTQELLALSPSGSLKIPVHFSFQGQHYDIPVVPDGYFGLKYPNGGGVRAFLLEADRNMEGIHSNDLEHKRSYLRKILQYQAAMTRPGRDRPALYHEHFGLDSRTPLLILNVTNSYQHMENIIKEVMLQTNNRGCSYMLFKTLPVFASKYPVPPVLSELLNTPWRRAGFGDIDISQP